jgi:hypothetical protein
MARLEETPIVTSHRGDFGGVEREPSEYAMDPARMDLKYTG